MEGFQSFRLLSRGRCSSSWLSRTWGNHPKSLWRPGNRLYHGIENNRLPPSAQVKIVPLFTDNYAYLLVDEVNLVCAAVDPADPETAEQFMNSVLSDTDGPELLSVFCTHKHWDHAGGNELFSNKYPGLNIFGPAEEEVPAVTHKVKGGDAFQLGGFNVEVYDAGCHTRGHIMFYVTGDTKAPPLLFCGDTLFAGGCGRFFEGNAQDMLNILYGTVANLPPETLVYCGHEYTLKNLEFALTVEPNNEMLQRRYEAAKKLRNTERPQPTIPTTIGAELQTNPFLRVHLPHIASSLGCYDMNPEEKVTAKGQETAASFVGRHSEIPDTNSPHSFSLVEVMQQLRKCKDQF